MTKPTPPPAAATPPKASKPTAEEEDEEDDYLSMAITEPTSTPQKETYTQRRQRLAREAEEKQPKSKSALSALEASARDAGLSTALPADSKGAQMLAKLGYTPGAALGAKGNPHARVEPLGVDVREGRGGVGLEGERKRKMREEMEGAEAAQKVQKVGEGDFRERVGREREEKRVEGLWWGGMRVLEGFEEAESEERGEGPGKRRRVGLLYRPLVREREEKERERRARFDLVQSLSRDRNYEDAEEEEQDRVAFGGLEVDVEEEDEELEEYLRLEPGEGLGRVVSELRQKWWYCFWCKYRYESEAMEGCPGDEEEDHD